MFLLQAEERGWDCFFSPQGQKELFLYCERDFCHPTGGALAEGFQERLKEFQNFERRFEVCISESHSCPNTFWFSIPTYKFKNLYSLKKVRQFQFFQHGMALEPIFSTLRTDQQIY